MSDGEFSENSSEELQAEIISLRRQLDEARAALATIEAETIEKCAKVADSVSDGCVHCEHQAATCVGRYDNMEEHEPACDDCCGHGNEDGRCVPVADYIAERIRALSSKTEPTGEKEYQGVCRSRWCQKYFYEGPDKPPVLCPECSEPLDVMSRRASKTEGEPI